MCIKILTVDDCQLLRQGIKSVIDDHDDIEWVAEASNGTEALEIIKETKPDVVVVDINMPGLNGIETTRKIKDYDSMINVLALSAHLNQSLIIDMLEAGASGYVTKDCISDELIHAIRAVHSGQRYICERATDILVETITKGQVPLESKNAIERLTDKEREMIKLVAVGLSSKQIAYKLGISIKTVDGRRRQIRKKLHLNSIADVVRFAIKKKLVQLDDESDGESDPYAFGNNIA